MFERGMGLSKHALRARLLAGAILAWLVVYGRTYVPSEGNGSDFQVFYAAATAEAHGMDSFRWPALWAVEQQLYNRGPGQATPFHFAPYGNPPPFALLLRPLTLVSEPAAYRLWAMVLLACALAGLYLALAGWPRRARLIATVLAAASPAALFNIRLGQTAGWMLLGLGLWLRLAPRRPFLAGASLTLGMVKPHLMLPVAAIAILTGRPGNRRRAALGVATALLGWITVAVLWDGGLAAFAHWWSSLTGFAGSIRLQPDVASVPGLYYSSVSQSTATVLNALCLIAATCLIALAAWTAQRADDRLRGFCFGTGIAWYLALTPYVHTGDQVLLLPPLLTLIGPRAEGLRENIVFLACAATLLAPLAVFRDYHTEGINALPPICVALAYLLVVRRSTQRRAAAGAISPCGASGDG